MPITTKLKHVITKGGDADEIKQVAVEEGMSSLKASAAYYVKEGITSFNEMMKVAYEAG